MNNSILVNDRKRALEISKQFNKAASIYGSPEYEALKGAKADNPTYRVVIKPSPKRTFEERITLDDIVLYVSKKSGKDSKQMRELNELCGVSIKEAGNKFDAVESANFMEIKKWFFLTYPELSTKKEKRQNRIDEILAEAAKNAAST